jgi:hypothetical protein
MGKRSLWEYSAQRFAPHRSASSSESGLRCCPIALSIVQCFDLKEEAGFGSWADPIQPERNSVLYLFPLILVKSNPIVQTL